MNRWLARLILGLMLVVSVAGAYVPAADAQVVVRVGPQRHYHRRHYRRHRPYRRYPRRGYYR